MPAPDLIFTAVVTDSRADCRGALFVALKGDRFDGHDYLPAALAAGAAGVCVEADRLAGLKLPADLPVLAVDDTLAAYQRLATAHRRRLAAGLKVIALTGSSGKTSTKEILRAILVAAHGPEAVLATEANTNNHVGVPQNLLRLNEKHRLAIIEMGTNHPGEMAVLSRIAEPDLAVIVSIGRAHLEFLGDLAGVAREKSAIWSRLRPGGTAMMPADGAETAILAAAAAPFRTLRFGETPDADLRVEYRGGTLAGARLRLTWQGGEGCDVEWAVPGRHQARNAAAAALVATALGLTPEAIAGGLVACRLPGMRMRIRRERDVIWVNDAYNANPDSVAAGLEWLADAVAAASVGRCFLCLGDMLELGNTGTAAHADTLAAARARLPDADILAIGPAMSAAVAKFAADPRLHAFADAPAAAAWLRPRLAPGALVYLKGSRGMALERIESGG
jgi:UDP-N-acetylmuramoyl-tripeptide--D-alanyl-D-alanine ligase